MKLLLILLICFIGVLTPILGQPLDTTSIAEGVKQGLLNGLTPAQFITYSTYAVIGAVLHMLLNLNERDKDSERSPKKLDLAFWQRDNATRVLTTFILILVTMAVFSQLMGTELNVLNAFLIGMSSDRLGQHFKDKHII